MKAFDELNFKADVSYTKTHEWAKKNGNVVVVGVDDYAQGALGDIVYVELPDVGASTNEALADSPDLVNTDPYGAAWMVEIEVSDSKDFDALMKVDAYKDYVKTLDH